MEDLIKLAEMAGALATPIAAIALSLYGWKKTGHIDLIKTMELAGDVLHVVREGIAKHGDEDKAIEEAVDAAGALRRKRLSKKLRGKLAARLRSLSAEAE